MSTELIDHLPTCCMGDSETLPRAWFQLCRRENWKQGYAALIPPVTGEGLGIMERTCVWVKGEYVLVGYLPLSDGLTEALKAIHRAKAFKGLSALRAKFRRVGK